MQRWLTVSGCVIAAGVLGLFVPAPVGAAPTDVQVRAQLVSLRLPFIENQGQVDAPVAYYASTLGGTLFVTRQGELVYSLPAPTSGASRGRRATASRSGWTLTETLRGGRGRPVGQDPSATGVSYFVGNDPRRWCPKAPTFDQLALGQVWPGVTVSLRARGRSTEKIFTIHPGASVASIRVRVGGTSALAVDPEGALVARTGLGPVTFTAPVAYQERDGVRRDVAVAYRLNGREYGFTVASHDPSLPLVIDPLLQSTYLGGNGSDRIDALEIARPSGDVYVSGSTSSSNFPGTAGGAQPAFGGGFDAFVARLNGNLTSLIQATYIGGSGNSEAANALAIHPATGDIYVAGLTNSTNFPGTAGGAQPIFGGGVSDGYVVRLPASLTSLTQATYLGGSGDDVALALAIHPVTGDVYVAGGTGSSNFPGTSGGAQPAFGGAPGTATFNGDAFVARLPASLTSLIQATYLGGSDSDVASALAIIPSGGIYVAGGTLSPNFPGTSGGAQPVFGGGVGGDAFVARLPASLTALTQATYFGGNSVENAFALAINIVTGDVYIAGDTNSTNLPGAAGGAQSAYGGGQDAFVARLNGGLTSLQQATYLGGNNPDVATALAIAPVTSDVYVTGITASANFPGTAGGAQPAFGGLNDAFVAKLTGSLTSLIQATYLGSSGSDQGSALGFNATTLTVYVGGFTTSSNFPGTTGGAQSASGGGGQDAFVARLSFGLALVDPLALSVLVNQPTFTAGQTLMAGGAVTDPGLSGAADFIVGILRPDSTIQFFTNTGIVLGNVADLKSFQPLAVAVPLGAPFSVAAPNFYTHQWAAGDLHGPYVFFVAAVQTGALATGTVSNDQIIGLATAPFSFP